MWKNTGQSRENVMKDATKLGVIRLDYNYPPSPGEIDHPGSFDCEVIYRVVPGFTYEMCKSGTLSDDVRAEFIEAVEWLQERNVSAITADCGLMMYFQNLARDHASIPVLLSPLTQLPAVTSAFRKDSQICIFTASVNTLKTMMNVILEEAGGDAHLENKLIIVGCENVPGFETVDGAKGEKVDVDLVEPGVVDLARSTLKDYPGIQAFLFECTQLPPYSNAVREATGVPVYDAITCSNFFINGFQEDKNFGKRDWKEPWSGQVKEYQLGQELPPEKINKLLHF